MEMPPFFSEKVQCGDRVAHQIRRNAYSAAWQSRLPRSLSQAKSPSEDGLFACEIVYTRRERRGYIKWGYPIEMTIPVRREMPFPVSMRPYFPSWKRWLFLRVSADVLRTSALCHRSFHGSSHSFR